MNRFDYVRPATVADAVAAGAKDGAMYLAGGTNLLDLMKVGVATPGTVVDISRLPGLARIEATDGGFRIGAMVRNADLARHAGFRAAFPSAAEALLSGASAQLRNAATVGGNLMQHTRCAYYYAPESACNRRTPGSGCDAQGGINGGMAVLGWTGACIATHPSDFCVPLVALGAVVEIEGPEGKREMPVEALHPLPTATEAPESALKRGEIITALRLGAEAAGFAANSRYLKLRERTSFAFALVSAAASLRIEDGRIAEARLALGGVAARPWRAHDAEAVLKGATPDAETFALAARAALEGARPSGENEHKIDLARRLAARALARAATGTPAEMPALPGSVMAPETGVAAHA
jgi:xanthine dehydrogenase YagS FAD-binding subunit